MKELKNPFKEMGIEKEPPADLKNKVMRQIKLSQLFADTIELFTLNYGKSLKDSISNEQNSEEKL
ncbi:MAG: hypothetical protein PF484_04230 [Bacteroidales bacterium]|jgi:hypothetical protein|nr:hypothetical protein [Bacteroidales bacterium]